MFVCFSRIVTNRSGFVCRHRRRHHSLRRFLHEKVTDPLALAYI